MTATFQQSCKSAGLRAEPSNPCVIIVVEVLEVRGERAVLPHFYILSTLRGLFAPLHYLSTKYCCCRFFKSHCQDISLFYIEIRGFNCSMIPLSTADITAPKSFVAEKGDFTVCRYIRIIHIGWSGGIIIGIEVFETKIIQ